MTDPDELRNLADTPEECAKVLLQLNAKLNHLLLAEAGPPSAGVELPWAPILGLEAPLPSKL